MRSIAVQSYRELGGTSSVLVRQKRDHIRLDALLEELKVATGDSQQEILTRVCRLVFSHAFAEEAVLWPALRRHLPDGEDLTLRVEQEHQEINELMTRLEQSRREDPERDQLIDRAIELLRQDVRDEEDVLLPRLQEALDVRSLQRLGLAWEVVRRTAPTRPHPVVARRPPGNVLAAAPLTVVDRSRDLLDSAARRSPDPLRPALASASGLLARASSRIEHVAVLQRGEHPSTRTSRTARRSL